LARSELGNGGQVEVGALASNHCVHCAWGNELQIRGLVVKALAPRVNLQTQALHIRDARKILACCGKILLKSGCACQKLLYTLWMEPLTWFQVFHIWHLVVKTLGPHAASCIEESTIVKGLLVSLMARMHNMPFYSRGKDGMCESEIEQSRVRCMHETIKIPGRVMSVYADAVMHRERRQQSRDSKSACKLC